ncbi:YdeI/OmpD-associated family protein [Acholeplasma manati]|uniref:YdeI/OmpD-associated family protein n=1 Tax=Paracholeplasma manati TaxID=591373 RepID=A0ABT2Y3L7_9MOLU|nr:YdeI/OmpD-associated family protein [Paracholeplasma manati]MCV2231329.1 YdeI/OmpD-associated family protein [Paracholeplasma manati]
MLDKLFAQKEVLVRNVPDSHESLFKPFEYKDTPPYDAILSFVYTLEAMKDEIDFAKTRLQPEGMLYLCYPKMKNNIGMAGIHRDHIFPFLKVDMDTGYIEGTQMRFNRMNAFDENYTLLGIKNDTKMKARSSTSMRVDDYAKYIPDIKTLLTNEQCLSFYVSLTPGYQKDWARYVFSAKTEATKQKRISEMIALLNAGIKSKNLAK